MKETLKIQMFSLIEEILVTVLCNILCNVTNLVWTQNHFIVELEQCTKNNGIVP